MRKYGLDNFSFEIIEELEDYSLSDEKEKYWIKYYNSYFNGYNESLGGDGGSVEGHCQGSLNGRALLNEEDVIKIRTLYSNGISKSKCYKLFEDKISLGGFTNVWNGRNWKHIMPEVYTKENKERNSKIGKGISGKKRRNFCKFHNLTSNFKNIIFIYKIIIVIKSIFIMSNNKILCTIYTCFI